MAFVPVRGVAQCEIRATYAGVAIENVLSFFEDTDIIPPGDLVGIGAAVAQSWFDNVMPQLSNAYQMREVHVRDLSIQDGGIATDTSTAGAAGNLLGDPEPGNVAFCLSLRTGFAGRSRRGRLYLAGLVASEVVDNHLNGGRVIAMVTGVDQLRQDMAALGFTLVVVSRISNGAPRVTGLATTVTSILAVDNRVDTQRRRLD